MDLDHFKSVNDTHGHDAGDRVLQDFADRIRSSVRGIDLACRYGGEEFLIAMPDTDKRFAGLVAERLRQEVEAQTHSRSPSQSGSPRRKTGQKTTLPRS